MRYRVWILILTVAAFFSFTADYRLAAEPSNDTSDRLMTWYGSFSPSGGLWTVKVAGPNGKIQITHRMKFGSTGLTPGSWRAKPGWFAYVENDQRAWAYDGDRYLYLLVVLGDKGTASYGPDRFPCPVPDEVLKRLSPAARKAIKVSKK